MTKNSFLFWVLFVTNFWDNFSELLKISIKKSQKFKGISKIGDNFVENQSGLLYGGESLKDTIKKLQSDLCHRFFHWLQSQIQCRLAMTMSSLWSLTFHMTCKKRDLLVGNKEHGCTQRENWSGSLSYHLQRLCQPSDVNVLVFGSMVMNWNHL